MILDLNDLPKRRINVRKLVAPCEFDGTNHSIQMIKRDLAFMLVEKIIDNEIFVQTYSECVEGYPFFEFRADCVVLTSAELGSIREEAFKEGVRHAASFSPRNDMLCSDLPNTLTDAKKE